jgi:hypothetical protein
MSPLYIYLVNLIINRIIIHLTGKNTTDLISGQLFVEIFITDVTLSSRAGLAIVYTCFTLAEFG